MKLLAALIGSVLVVPASHALACSGPACFPTYLFPAAGSVPANMVQLYFRAAGSYSDLDAGRPEPRLYRREGDAKISVPFTRTVGAGGSEWITPMQTQAAGSRLLLEADQGLCESKPFSAELTVTEAAALPNALGTLSAELKRGDLQVAVWNGSCDGQLDAAYADISVRLTEAAVPYASLFAYRMFVDDAARAFSSSLGSGERRPQGEDRIFAVCSKDSRYSLQGSDVPAGKHRVRFEGTLPDGTTLSTPEIEVELSCGSAPPAPTVDASVPPAPRDASVGRVDGGVDAGVTTSEAKVEDDSSALAARRPTGLALSLLALLLKRRRRRFS